MVDRERWSRRLHGLRASTLAGIAVVPAFLTACGGGSSRGGVPFAVESFVAGGLTEIERNRPLVVTFTAPVDRESVGAAGFHVTLGGSILPTRAVVDGRTVTLWPTVLAGDRNDFVPPNDPP